MARREIRAWACAGLLLLAASAARAGFWGRDALTSSWAVTPPRADGDDSDWSESDGYEDDGLGVAAMNNGTDLYLKLTASTREGRAQLTGIARQDVALWFFAADGKTRAWGLRMPYSRMTPPDEDELRYGPVVTAGAQSSREPELLQTSGVPASSGTVVSTAAWPTDMMFRLGFSGRRPVWHLRLPLARLTPDKKGVYPLDFLVTGKGTRLPAAPHPPPAAKEEGGRRGGGAHGGESAPREDSGKLEPVEFNLTLRLTRDPALTR